MKRIFYIFIAVASLILLGGCSDEAMEQPQRKDYSNYSEFLKGIAESADYCTELTSSSSFLKVRTKSGKLLNINQNCPFFELDSEGKLLKKGASTGIEIDVESTWYKGPEVTFDENGSISIEGKDTGASSEGLCAIECGKYVYFYFYEHSVRIPSEIHGPFNPPLPKGKGIVPCFR